MAVSYIGSSAIIATNGGAPGAVTPHASSQAGDLLVFFHYGRATGGNETWTQASFTEVFDSVTANNGHLVVAYRVMQAGDTSFTATVGNYTSGTSGETILEWILTFRGVDTGNPIPNFTASNSTWASSLNIGPIGAPGTATVNDGDMAVVFGGRFENVTGHTTLTGDSLTWSDAHASGSDPNSSLGLDAGAVVQLGLNATGADQTLTAKTITTTGTAQVGAGRAFIVEAVPIAYTQTPTDALGLTDAVALDQARGTVDDVGMSEVGTPPSSTTQRGAPAGATTLGPTTYTTSQTVSNVIFDGNHTDDLVQVYGAHVIFDHVTFRGTGTGAVGHTVEVKQGGSVEIRNSVWEGSPVEDSLQFGGVDGDQHAGHSLIYNCTFASTPGEDHVDFKVSQPGAVVDVVDVDFTTVPASGRTVQNDGSVGVQNFIRCTGLANVLLENTAGGSIVDCVIGELYVYDAKDWLIEGNTVSTKVGHGTWDQTRLPTGIYYKDNAFTGSFEFYGGSGWGTGNTPSQVPPLTAGAPSWYPRATVALAHGRAHADQLGLADSSATALGHGRDFTDAVGAADAATQDVSGGASEAPTDGAGLTDLVLVTQPSRWTYSASVRAGA